MINMKKVKERKSKISKYTLAIVIVTITIFCIETVGYAAISSLIRINGDVTWKPDGKLEITRVNRTTLTRATENSSPSFEGTHITFDLTFTPNNNNQSRVVYNVTLTNNSSFTHSFTNSDIASNYTNTNRYTTNVQVTGLTEGQRIAPGEEVTFTVTLTCSRRNIGQGNNSVGTTEITINTNALSNGKLVANLDNNTGSLLNNNRAHFIINAMNTRPYAQTLELATTGDKVEIVDASGNPLTNLSINASETKTLDFYIQAKNSAMFGASPYSAGIMLTSSDGTVISLGNVSLTVPISGDVPKDEEAPIISNVTVAKNSTDGSVTVSYNSSDASSISTYYIQACKENNGSYTCANAVTSNSKSYTYTGLEYGTYKFRVYAEDEWGNKATTNEINNATTSSGHASESTSAFYRWKVTITFSLENMYYDGNNAQGTVDVDYMQDYSFTLTPIAQNYELPNAITVSTSNGNLTSGTGYTYTQSSGAVTIYGSYVTENLTVTGTATQSGNICLVEGTKIKLYDGSYKNIEDINYDDLLSVWSYDTGSITYEYPVWIERWNETTSYQKTTFSDGTILNTVGLHQVFSLDENKFVNIIDNNGYIKVGTRVAKEVNGKIVPVKVTKVETINKKVKYYFVGSAIYYNVISEDIITTADQVYEGMTLSNMYPFDNNIKWKPIRKEIISQKDALFEYDNFRMIPYYLFYGVRAPEVRLFVNSGLVNIDELMIYLNKILLNPNRIISPITDKEGNRLWMVTTSDDISKHLYHEGDIYVLKQPKNKNNFVGWFNTVDNKIYKPGDKYKVILGTHFIAKYK